MDGPADTQNILDNVIQHKNVKQIPLINHLAIFVLMLQTQQHKPFQPVNMKQHGYRYRDVTSFYLQNQHHIKGTGLYI